MSNIQTQVDNLAKELKDLLVSLTNVVEINLSPFKCKHFTLSTLFHVHLLDYVQSC